jgi:AcrR family transcriptional regulator
MRRVTNTDYRPSPATAEPDGAAGARRTQEQRRAETRAKLLDATIESLLAVGYSGTTTRRVSELAGVSLGAQTHHFPHRTDLLAAAAERMAEQRLARMLELARDLPAQTSDRTPALLDLMWADFSSDVFTVFVKLWVAAADDPELHERMVELERQLARAITESAIEFLGEMTNRRGWESQLLLALSAVRGLALTERFEPRVGARRDPWPSLRSALIESFEAWAAATR